MRLLSDLCLVTLAPQQDRTASGLIAAPSMTPVICYGKVRQTGHKAVDVKAGDIVAFPPSAGEALDGYFATPHVLIREAEISAVFEKETT